MTIQKVIRGEDGDGFNRWEPGDVAGQAAKAGRGKSPASVRELEGLQKAAYDEAYARGREEGAAKGRQEGLAAGQAEARQLAQRVRKLLDSLASPIKEMDEAIERQLVQLSFTLAQQIIRREIQAQPGEVVPVVREALALLPLASRDVKVCLHPEDARFMRESMGAHEDAAWKIVEDGGVSRGGCRVQTASSVIDATLERRLAVLCREILGGERSADGEDIT